jgi:cytoskeletal protein RodZ
VSIGNPPPTDTPDDRPSIGRALAQARANAGLTVEELSNRTRVRVPIVRAIEQDDFSRCGGDVYARGHIRTLAREVGLDPEPLVRMYSAQYGAEPAPTPVAPLYEAERIRSEPRRPNWTAAMVAAIVAVVGFVAFTVFSGGGGGGKQPVAGKPSAVSPTAQRQTDAHPSPHPSGKPSPATSDSAIAAAPADKVTVKLTAEAGKSWVQAIDHNGRSLFQGVLSQGRSKTFTDEKRIRLVVGNAGGVRLFVNGKDLGAAGQDGQVVRLDFTPGDPQAG